MIAKIRQNNDTEKYFFEILKKLLSIFYSKTASRHSFRLFSRLFGVFLRIFYSTLSICILGINLYLPIKHPLIK